jgi:uncharacterized protein (DUF488 family)
MTVYSIGYQRLAPARLAEIAAGLDALVIDVRGKPVSRNASYRKPALERLLGRRYLWMGDTLSGPMHGAGVLPEGIEQLRRLARRTSLILMCMEHEPHWCHRHMHICMPHFPNALHIHDDDLIRTKELQRALDQDDGYEYDSLAEHMKRLTPRRLRAAS